MRTYKTVSADSHVNYPPGDSPYPRHIEPKFRDRAPRIERTAEGYFWVIDGERRPYSGGLDNVAGRKPEEYKVSGLKAEEVRAGGHDPVERLKDMDIDQVDAEILYTNVIGGETPDAEFRRALYRAHNDWMHEFAAADPERLFPLALLPMEDGVEAIVAELERTARLGFRGALISTFPSTDTPYTDAYYDKLWEAAQALQMPLSMHRASGRAGRLGQMFPAGSHPAANIVKRNFAVIDSLVDLVFMGVFERFPDLKLVSAESSIGWLPFLIERCDDVYRRHRYWSNLPLPEPPSFYFHRNVYATFQDDRVGVMARAIAGVENLMWASDYPHSDTTWPRSQEFIAEQFKGVPEEEKRRIVCENAQELYRIGR